MHHNGLRPAIVAIGGSAGALEPLQRVVAGFQESMPAAVFVTIHTPADAVSALPHILSRSGPLFATHAIDGAPFAAGRIYIAPPDCHLTVGAGRMNVSASAKENGYRPSIDVLFRSAAQTHGAAACGVLLSGALDDGVAGLDSIHEAGGFTIVQDPDEALFQDMPQNAIRSGDVDAVRRSDEIASDIEAFAQRIRESGDGGPADVAPDERTNGKASVFTCPDCGGTLWELENDFGFRFRCRTGHSYNMQTMVSMQRDCIERSIFSGIRALQERADLLRRVARRAAERGDSHTAARLRQQVSASEEDQQALYATLDSVLGQHQP